MSIRKFNSLLKVLQSGSPNWNPGGFDGFREGFLQSGLRVRRALFHAVVERRGEDDHSLCPLAGFEWKTPGPIPQKKVLFLHQLAGWFHFQAWWPGVINVSAWNWEKWQGRIMTLLCTPHYFGRKSKMFWKLKQAHLCIAIKIKYRKNKTF